MVQADICLLLAEVGSRIGLSPLLSCLAAGFVARNAASEAADEMDELLHRVRLPVLIVFFAAHLGELPHQALNATPPPLGIPTNQSFKAP